MIQYASRLRSLFQCYLDARKVTTFGELFDLSISDHIKDGLTQGDKYFIGDKEAEGTLKSIEIAHLLDVYQAIRLEERGKDRPRSDYRPEYKKTGGNKPYKQYNSGYKPSSEGRQNLGGGGEEWKLQPSETEKHGTSGNER